MDVYHELMLRGMVVAMAAQHSLVRLNALNNVPSTLLFVYEK